MFVFCGKFCVCSDKRVSIVVKIKYMNFDNISDICDKLNLTTYILQQLTNITTFDTFDGTDLSIFVLLLPPFLQEKVDTKREVHEVMYMDTFGST